MSDPWDPVRALADHDAKFWADRLEQARIRLRFVLDDLAEVEERHERALAEIDLCENRLARCCYDG